MKGQDLWITGPVLCDFRSVENYPEKQKERGYTNAGSQREKTWSELDS